MLVLPHPSEAATTTEHAFVHGGRKRTYRLITPSGHTKTKPAPLVLALHGGGGEAKQFDASTGGQFRREADKRGWVVALPQGIAKGWNDGRPLDTLRARQRKGVDDVAFLSAVIDKVHASHGIDRSRVYATGISNGGFMSIRLGLELSDRIAAIAPVTAQLQKVHADKRPAQPVGLMVINGTSDPLVPYGGGHVTAFGRKRGAIFSTNETIVRWRAFNGCQTDAQAQPLPDKAPRDGTTTTVTRYTPCRRGAEVVLVRVQGGGHAWPGGTQYLPQRLVGRASRDFEATPRIFDFFARHRRTPITPAPAPPPKKKEAK
ncbi:MAG: PHB depolymerase family esterase [Planctomycetota bacterium]|nr:PHB depolymerase family esterase [Planctomycetota bacterium]